MKKTVVNTQVRADTDHVGITNGVPRPINLTTIKKMKLKHSFIGQIKNKQH